jgi:DNA-binding Xre family transcriptional regulator
MVSSHGVGGVGFVFGDLVSPPRDVLRTDLIPLLAQRGIQLSTAQVYRLVTDRPERLSMKTLTALCDILSCGPSDLIEPYVEAASRRPAVGEGNIIDVRGEFRPERTRILDDE